MGTSVVKGRQYAFDRGSLRKPEDYDFVLDLMTAYDRATVKENKVMLAARISELLLKGVSFERLEMKGKAKG